MHTPALPAEGCESRAPAGAWPPYSVYTHIVVAVSSGHASLRQALLHHLRESSPVCQPDGAPTTLRTRAEPTFSCQGMESQLQPAHNAAIHDRGNDVRHREVSAVRCRARRDQHLLEKPPHRGRVAAGGRRIGDGSPENKRYSPVGYWWLCPARAFDPLDYGANRDQFSRNFA